MFGSLGIAVIVVPKRLRCRQNWRRIAATHEEPKRIRPRGFSSLVDDACPAAFNTRRNYPER
jgi:hypothetical protein